MARMRAARFHGREDVRVEQVERPSPEPGEALVRVWGCGICGSDVRLFRQGPVASMMDRWPVPRILGHEFSGVVEELGSGTSGLRAGDRVAAAPATWCGQCFYCRKGARTLCLEPIDFGSTHPGGLAEYVCIPAELIRQGGLVVVPDSIGLDRAAMLEPLGTCIRGLCTQGALSEGNSVLIIGDGPIGLIQVQLARLLGAGPILLAGHHEARLQQGQLLGADETFDSRSPDFLDRVRELTEGRGVDLVVSSVPSQTALEHAAVLVRGGGRIVLFAGVGRGSAWGVSPNRIHYEEITIVGSYNCTIEEFRQGAELATALNLEAVIDQRLPLADCVEGFNLMADRRALKVLVEMRAEGLQAGPVGGGNE